MSSEVNNGNAGEGLSTVGLEDTRCSLDELMITAYGNKLLYCDGGPCDPVWYQHWSIIAQCMGQRYLLHGGSVVKSTLTYCVLSFKICLCAPTSTILNK